ncbi:MAG: hypothetical protein LBQ14_00195 [Treponema sp.]|nr:hypothetical protein [Treponema sp.]
MKRRIKNLALSSVSVMLLLVFTFTSCSSPFLNNLPAETDTYVVEVGQGTPRFTYLDNDYNPLDSSDGGGSRKTVFWVDDNPMAEGVMLISETFDGSDDVVRINNDNTGCSLSMFFHKGESFPWAFDIQIGDKRGGARLSSYDNDNQRYSIAFQMEGEYFTLDNVALNRSILSAYTDDADLTEDQNTRMRNICTALGVYVSIEQAFPSDQEVIALWGGWLNPRNWGIFDWLRAAVTAIGVVVVAVAYILCPPAAFVGTVIVTAAIEVAVWIGIDKFEDELTPPPLGPMEQIPTVSITCNGVPVGHEEPVYVPPSGEVVVDISYIGITNPVQMNLYDHNVGLYLDAISSYNGLQYIFTNETGTQIKGIQETPNFLLEADDKIKASRTGIPGSGYFDTTVDIFINFGVSVIVNGNVHSATIKVPNSDNTGWSSGTGGNIFLLRFSILP